MKTKLLLTGLIITLGTFNLKAQFIVTDPINTAQSIVNSANEIIQTSSTVSNVIKNFQEVKQDCLIILFQISIEQFQC